MSLAPYLPAATGCYGLVGRMLLRRLPHLVPLELAPAPPDLAGQLQGEPRLPPVDITDAGQVSAAFRALAEAARGRPVVAFHLAALTDTKSGDEDLFERVNVRGTENVLRAALETGARLIHISTDYVFAGEARKDAPYLEEDRPAACPPGAYAASKFRAERLVLESGGRAAVVRIAFPYGGLGNRPGLAEKLLQRFEESRSRGRPVRLFNDQLICPSYIPDIAAGLQAVAEKMASGAWDGGRVCHLVGPRSTPHAFGGQVREVFGFQDVALEPSSVAGTAYAQNLWLSSDRTRVDLGWSPAPHERALREFRARAIPNS